jgi:DNA polymerase-1
MPEDARKLCVALPEHEMEELDFSQLEMVGAAAGSKCPDLIYDLTHGVDIHKNTATTVFGADQAEAKRKLAKNVNFGVLYGGKAPGLSKQTGVDRDTIQKLIDAFYSRYPAIARWQKQVYEDVLDGMEPLDVRDGEQRYKSDWILPNSGRKFRFVETEAPMWLRKKINRKWSFSPNHTANYPIQGFAGGDIVMHALWWLWASIRQSKLDVKFRMTVHDSIIIEKLAGLDLRSHYDDACHQTVVKYGLPVPLGYDVETGITWS